MRFNTDDVPENIPDWWQCPECGWPTAIVFTHKSAKRECVECSWEFVLFGGQND